MVALELADNHLVGADIDVTSLLASLPWLQVLDISGNPGLRGSKLAAVAATGDSGAASASQNDSPTPHPNRLTYLDVSNDLLDGSLPGWIDDAPLSYVNLMGNRFAWSETAGPGAAALTLITACRTSGLSNDITCQGLPPLSCAAFGTQYRLDVTDPSQCTSCREGDVPKSIAAMVGAFVLFALALAAYVHLTRRHEDAMERWVSTISLFVAHAQTIGIIGAMQLEWPPQVEQATQLISLSVVDASFLRPECLARDGINAFALIAVTQLAIMLATLLVFLVMSMEKCLAGEGRSDGVHYILTILLSCIFTMSWRLFFRTLEQLFGGDNLVLAAFVLASLLLALELWLVVRYLSYVVAKEKSAVRLQRITERLSQRNSQRPPESCRQGRITGVRRSAQASRSGGGGGARERWGAILDQLCPSSTSAYSSHDSVARIEARTDFLTRRYAEHAPYWQFVVWMRQFCLFLDYMIAALILDFGRLKPGTAARNGVVWAHAIVAILLVAVSWRLHARARPFRYAYQNAVEHGLFASDLLLLTLGTVYTAVRVSNVERGALQAVETLMVLVLVGSILGALGWVAYKYRTGGQDTTQARLDEERTQGADERGLQGFRRQSFLATGIELPSLHSRRESTACLAQEQWRPAGSRRHTIAARPVPTAVDEGGDRIRLTLHAPNLSSVAEACDTAASDENRGAGASAPSESDATALKHAPQRRRHGTDAAHSAMITGRRNCRHMTPSTAHTAPITPNDVAKV